MAPQPKRMVQRLFKGLAGAPYDPEAAPAELVPPVAVIVKASARSLKDADGDRRDVLACIVKALKGVHKLTIAEVRRAFHPMGIEHLRGLAEEYDIKLPVPNPLNLDLLADFERREKRAEAARQRRKHKANELAAIKRKLKTPVAEVLKIAKQAAQQEELERQVAERELQKELSMNRGKFMTDAPHGKGELVTGGNDSDQMSLMAAARERAAFLGSVTFNPETDEVFWPENDRGRVTPEGVGHRPGDREGDKGIESGAEFESGGEFKDNKTETGKDAPILSGGTSFEVKLNTFDYTKLFEDLFHIYCIKVLPPSGDHNSKDCFYICRLCERFLDWKNESKRHIETVHGETWLPDHDSRFGDVIRRYIKSGWKGPKNLPGYALKC